MASNDQVNEKINVKDVCKKFILKSDELLANKLQTEECFDHYKKNRFFKQINRENIQKSISLVKTIQTDENENQLNAKAFNQKLKLIEKSDELVAYELQQEFLKELELEQQRKDEELAKKLQQEEILNDPVPEPIAHQNIYEESFYHDPDDDFSLAMYLQRKEQESINLENQVLTRANNENTILNDEELARRLQESENSRLAGNLYSTNQQEKKKNDSRIVEEIFLKQEPQSGC